MILGSNQYVFEREDDVEFIVMVHHPLSWFRDQQDAQRYMDRSRVILSGHEHVLHVRKEQTDTGSEFLKIYAGAANPPETGGAYPFRYNWLEFGLHVNGKNQYLRVTVHPRVWEHTRTEFVPDTNRLGGRSSSSFEILCPSFKKPLVTTLITPRATDLAAANTSDAKGGVPMGEHNALDYERLQYYFWTYLDDWQERLKILVDLNVLPGTKNQPVPHTLERMALDRAKQSGKLHALWEAVMQHVPSDKRMPNPFTGEETKK